jgi:adenosylcobinamide-GDP ribazoletransferase
VSALADVGHAAAAAISFLTRIPLGWLRLDADDVARGAGFFPLVGAGVGALVGLVAESLDGVLSVFLAAGVAVALEAVITGAIHLDGLADTADGLGAARASEPSRSCATLRSASSGRSRSASTCC